MKLNGFLLLNKPAGMRCTDLVNRISKLTGTKVGHAGTLDSTASGLVLVLLGAATRFTEAVMNWPKTYKASAQLGWETDSDDASGQAVTERRDATSVTLRSVELALLSQLGLTAQEPPQISALKVEGRRAHSLARDGHTVRFKPRFVENISFTSIELKEGSVAAFTLRCHRGCYVRSVARLLGRRLGTGAHLIALQRCSLGPFEVTEALDARELTRERIAAAVRPLDDIARALPHLEADERVGKRLVSGLPQWASALPPFQAASAQAFEPLVVISPLAYSLCKTVIVDGRRCLKAGANVMKVTS